MDLIYDANVTLGPGEKLKNVSCIKLYDLQMLIAFVKAIVIIIVGNV
jgi:hypothetical protein